MAPFLSPRLWAPAVIEQFVFLRWKRTHRPGKLAPRLPGSLSFSLGFCVNIIQMKSPTSKGRGRLPNAITGERTRTEPWKNAALQPQSGVRCWECWGRISTETGRGLIPNDGIRVLTNSEDGNRQWELESPDICSAAGINHGFGKFKDESCHW